MPEAGFQTAHEALVDCIQLMVEGRTGGYAQDTYGPTADRLIAFLAQRGYSLQPTEPFNG